MQQEQRQSYFEARSYIEFRGMGVAMRRRSQLLKLGNSIGRLKGANERLSSYRNRSGWEHDECGVRRSFSSDHAKRVEAAYAVGLRDVCSYDVTNPDKEWEHNFENMYVTLFTERKSKDGWWWLRRMKIFDFESRR